MPSWLTFKSLLAAINGFIGLIRDFFAWKKSAEDRQAGRDEANADTLRQNAERVAIGKQAGDEAERDHAAYPDDDDKAFDTSFRRD